MKPLVYGNMKSAQLFCQAVLQCMLRFLLLRVFISGSFIYLNEFFIYRYCVDTVDARCNNMHDKNKSIDRLSL